MKAIDRPAISGMVCRSVTEVLQTLQPGDVPPVSESTILFGPRGILDSMALTTLIVDVEQNLNAEYDVGLTLADDKALSQRSSPFRTVKTLADYICSLLETQS